MTSLNTSIEPEQHLSRFGLTSFRAGQQEVIAALLAGKDCLCIMPTGGGKSLCYQLPALAREGTVLVVSPLIALMKDQVDALERLEIRATFVNSSLPPSEQQARIARMAEGGYDLVYIAPERLRNPRFLEAVRQVNVQLLAVDEAHCVSEWGHDFRPDYARLGRFRQRLRNPQTIALTATATPTVRQDVVELLHLNSAEQFVTGFARPNLRMEVQAQAGNAAKEEALLAFLEESPGAGIVYGSTRKRCDQLQELLQQRTDRKVGLYHAGLPSDQRRMVQDEFMSCRCEIVVATNAFGMGIDRADLRFVVHYNIPGSLEAYYQEAGRAGRDGLDSRCLLLYSASDRYVQEFFIENAYPSREVVAQVYNYLRSIDADPIEITLLELKDRLELPLGSEGVGACEHLLEKCGAVERLASQQNMAAVRIDSDLPTLVDLLPGEAKIQRKVLRAVERLTGDLRYERIYFHPARLAAELDLQRDAVTRALRELNKLEPLDYVPPFRGRALRMLRRDTPFEQLTIDFDQLQQRQAAEYEKLERMIRYARTSRCRQREILDYFGDQSRRACGTCDNCTERMGDVDRSRCGDDANSEDHLLETVRVVLSGVARTHGRFGKQVIAQMLWGSKSAKMAKWKFQRLSTFGLLKHLRQSEIVELIDALVRLELVEQIEIDRYRPVIQLTERGAGVMHGETALELAGVLPRQLVAKLQSAPAAAPGDRSDAKTKPEKVPSPADVEATAAPAANASESPRAAITNTRAENVQPSHYWTWRLLSDGYTPQQCTQIRRLEAGEIVDHALRALDSGLSVEVDWVLSSEQIAVLESVIGTGWPERIRPLLPQLPDDLSYQHVQLYLKCRRAKQVLPK